MFDIGFLELLIIAVVGLIVIGPERLPGAIRTGSLWLGRIKRGFNDIKLEVEQELHNEAVMQELKNLLREIKTQTQEFQDELDSTKQQMQQEVQQELDEVKAAVDDIQEASIAPPKDDVSK